MSGDRPMQDLDTRELAAIDHGWSAYVQRHSVDARTPEEYVRTHAAYEIGWAEGFKALDTPSPMLALALEEREAANARRVEEFRRTLVVELSTRNVVDRIGRVLRPTAHIADLSDDEVIEGFVVFVTRVMSIANAAKIVAEARG